MRTVDLRYRGQGYELNVSFNEQMLTAFHELHRQRYGFANEQRDVEIVNVRVRMIAQSEPFNPIKKELGKGMGSRHCWPRARCISMDELWRRPSTIDRRYGPAMR